MSVVGAEGSRHPAEAFTGAPEPGTGDAAGTTPPRNRMGIALLALGGFFVAGYLLLETMGLTGPLVCGVGDCSTVQASPWAVFLGVPVPAWGVGGYVLLFAASLAGLRPGAAADRRIAGALVALAFVAFAFSAYLTALEAFVIRAWCQWCVISAVIATLIFAFSLAELPRLRSD